jgi:hypothetical protein
MSKFTETRITFPRLFSQFSRVEIPIIQRDYAQGRKTAEDVRSGLLEAMFEALDRGSSDKALPLDLDFVYGSITKTRDDAKEVLAFAPLDGQQRLTTLFLLHWFSAWKDGEGDKFREVYRYGDKSRFAYLVRPSSTEFFDTLSGFFPDPTDMGEGELSSFIEEQPWFFLYWKQDPTIQSALVMLDAIQHRFGVAKGLYAKLTDEQSPRITFQFLDLQQFGLSDDLYIKMNARGKPLTAFENFKAKLEQRLATDFKFWKEEGDAGEMPVKDYFSHRIETRWADLFWHFRDPKSQLFDEKFMALYRELAIVTRDPDDEAFEDVVQELRGQKGGFTYQSLNKIGAVDERMLRCLFGTLDRLSGSDGGMQVFLGDAAYLDERALFEKAIDSKMTLNYDESVLLRAYTGYLVDHREAIDANALWNWGRVVTNLTRNTIYNRPEDFQRSLRSLNALFEHADTILHYLGEHAGEIAGFNQQQVREEQLKAQLILMSDEWRDLIVEAECHGYFSGQIEFLFRFSGVLDRWVEVKFRDWSKEEDEMFRSSFESYFKRAKLIFDGEGLRSFDGFLWERALLSEGDYLVDSGRNKSFLKSEGRETSWKRLLRGDPKKEGEEVKRNIVSRVMDQLNADGDACADLAGIIERAEVGDPWRKLLVENPEAIGYCENRLIRWLSSERIFLLKRSQLNGAHGDLFTYCLFKGELESLTEHGDLQLFEGCEYRSVTDTGNDAGIVLVGKQEDHRFSLEVLNSRDDEALFLIACPAESDSFSEKEIWPALVDLGFTEVKRENETRAMELAVERKQIVEKLRELGTHLKKTFE